jgi:hypothetical protein
MSEVGNENFGDGVQIFGKIDNVLFWVITPLRILTINYFSADTS